MSLNDLLNFKFDNQYKINVNFETLIMLFDNNYYTYYL